MCTTHNPRQAVLLVILALAVVACVASACAAPPARPANVCDPCAANAYAAYKACWEPRADGSKCDLCDEQCCAPGRDRCCCIHRREDCFKVCVTRHGRRKAGGQ